MKEIINIYTTSLNSAKGGDILLRETRTTRLLFRTQIVNNNNNPEASVNGSFIFQKKRLNDSWTDHNDLKLSELKADEWIKLDLKSEEVLTLITEIQQRRSIYKEFGINNGEYQVVKADSNLQDLFDKFDDKEELLLTLLDNPNFDAFKQMIEWVLENDGSDKILERLKSLNATNLDQLNTLIGITNLKTVISVWNDNKAIVRPEKFWQDVFKKHTWILSQILSSPTILIDSEVYVGGKSHDNTAGKLLDFLYSNPLSKDVVLIEIKTPQTLLVEKNAYRAGVFSVSEELMGAVIQVLTYKATLQKEFQTLLYNNHKKDIVTDFDIINPSCIILAGKLSALDNEQKYSFELFRRELKNVTLITFDELFERINSFIKLLET